MSKSAPAAKPADPSLSDFLCFAIYSANLTFGKAYKPLLDQLGLTYTQFITVVALWEEDNQTVSGLGEKLFLESNTLTPILKKLEVMGYVYRQRNSADERQVLVGLTDSGKQLRQQAFNASLFEACGLTQDEFAATRAAVVKLRTNLANSMKT